MNNVCEYIDELISEVKESANTTSAEKDLIVRYLNRVYEWSFNHDLNSRHLGL